MGLKLAFQLCGTFFISTGNWINSKVFLSLFSLFFPIYISKTLSKVFHLKIHSLTSLKCMADDLNIHFGRCS